MKIVGNGLFAVRCEGSRPAHHASMVNKRPPLYLVKAKKAEIALRYAHHARVGKRTRSMAAIRIAELERWLTAEIGTAGEIAESQWAADMARIFVHHFVALADGNRRASRWLDHRTPWIDIRSREILLSEANHCPLKWSADKLAAKIGLTDARRTWLKITTIGAIDCNREQRAKRRNAAKAERERNRRAANRAKAVSTI